VLSITETQYFGDDVLLISPDSDCLSVLQAGLTSTARSTQHEAQCNA
jgi:hypothetical protein